MATNYYDILVVEDHELIVKGIIQILQSVAGLKVADAVDTGEKASALIAKRDYDVYILDIQLPGEISGLELIKIIRKKNPRARIVVSTMHEAIWLLNQLVKLKVDAVILKGSASVHLLSAVNSVLLDVPYTCPRFDKIRDKLEKEESTVKKDLPTRREQDVLQIMSKGLKSSEIAVELGISENTVETLRKRLIQKFKARNAIALVVMAIKKGWVDISND